MKLILKLLFFLFSCISIISTVITSQSSLFFSSFISKNNEISSDLFYKMLTSENHYFKQNLELEEESLFTSALEFATNINIKDARSFIFDEIPGLYAQTSEIIVAGEGTDFTNLPIESAPPIEELLKEREINDESLENIDTSPPVVKEKPEKNTVFIYHSHNRESFLPHLNDKSSPQHKEINITLVGERFGQRLLEKGIGATVDKTDIAAILGERNLNYNQSYNVSREVVQEAMASNNDYNYFIDIHRDGAKRSATTITMGGKDYARVFFVVGKKNPNYHKNEELAHKLNSLIDEKYPGLSRGVVAKDQGNALYNQDLSPNSIIIEIGGHENNLEELYNTADLLAEIFAEFYWEDAVEVSN